MTSFVKVYQSILDSSVWSESYATRLVWLTMLVMAGPDGRVEASVGGLARRACVTREECDHALSVLLAADPDDKSGINEGRRITVCDRGWHITNHQYYRDLRTEKQIQTAERVKRYRQKQAESVTCNASNAAVTPVTPEAEAEAEAEADQDPPVVPLAGDQPKRGRSKTRKAMPWPGDWQPTEQHRSFAAEHGLDVDLEAKACTGHFEGQPIKSPNGRFTAWLANQVRWKRERASKQGPIRATRAGELAQARLASTSIQWPE